MASTSLLPSERERLGLWLVSSSVLISERSPVKAINLQLAEFKVLKEAHAKKQHQIRQNSTLLPVVSSKLLMHSLWLLKKGQITPASAAMLQSTDV